MSEVYNTRGCADCVEDVVDGHTVYTCQPSGACSREFQMPVLQTTPRMVIDKWVTTSVFIDQNGQLCASAGFISHIETPHELKDWWKKECEKG